MNIGMIGAGNIASSMANTVNQMVGVKCFGVASRSLDRALDFKKKFKVLNAFGSYEQLVSNPEVDLIYIATPHSHHYEHAMLALENNKHVLCEKSFTVNGDQARTLIKTAKEKKLFIAEAMWSRYLPARVIIEDIIKRGEIGKITSLTANFGATISHIERIAKPELAGGALLDLGVYPINYAAMYLGTDFEKITSSCSKNEYGVDVINSITLTYKSGIIAMLHSSAVSKLDQRCVIYGTKGFVVAENIMNVKKIIVKGEKVNKIYEVPPQITGYEYEVLSAKNAISDGLLETLEMPHSETIAIMDIMDIIRKQCGIKFPFEKV